MIRVTIFRLSDHSVVAFKVEGHAGYAEEGKDIVCSAVSALTQTAMAGLKRVAGMSLKEMSAKGSLECHLEGGSSSEGYSKAQVILETMVIGLKEIEETYGKYLKITEQVIS